MDVMTTVWDFLVGIINALFNFLGGVLSTFFFWLPADPFSDYWGFVSSFAEANATAISWLNWFVPVQLFSAVFGVVLSCLLAWIGYMLCTHVFDWVKRIKQTINPGG